MEEMKGHIFIRIYIRSSAARATSPRNVGAAPKSAVGVKYEAKPGQNAYSLFHFRHEPRRMGKSRPFDSRGKAISKAPARRHECSTCYVWRFQRSPMGN